MLFTTPVSLFFICDTGLVNNPFLYDSAPCLRHIPRMTSELPQLSWHGEEPSLKPSCADTGTVLDEIRRILMHRQNIQPVS